MTAGTKRGGNEAQSWKKIQAQVQELTKKAQEIQAQSGKRSSK